MLQVIIYKIKFLLFHFPFRTYLVFLCYLYLICVGIEIVVVQDAAHDGVGVVVEEMVAILLMRGAEINLQVRMVLNQLLLVNN